MPPARPVTPVSARGIRLHPGVMPELHRHPVLGARRSALRDVLPVGLVGDKVGWELHQDEPELAGGTEWTEGFAKEGEGVLSQIRADGESGPRGPVRTVALSQGGGSCSSFTP